MIIEDCLGNINKSWEFVLIGQDTVNTQPNIALLKNSDDLGNGYPKLDFRFPGIIRKMGLSQVEHGYSAFLANFFLAYLMIFQKFCITFRPCSTL